MDFLLNESIKCLSLSQTQYLNFLYIFALRLPCYKLMQRTIGVVLLLAKLKYLSLPKRACINWVCLGLQSLCSDTNSTLIKLKLQLNANAFKSKPGTHWHQFACWCSTLGAGGKFKYIIQNSFGSALIFWCNYE